MGFCHSAVRAVVGGGCWKQTVFCHCSEMIFEVFSFFLFSVIGKV